MLLRHTILFVAVVAAILPAAVQAQRLAIAAPESTGISQRFAESLHDSLTAAGSKVLDPGASAAAFTVAAIATPFNMTTGDAKKAGAIVGTDFLILVKGITQRRTSLEKKDYFESSAAIFVISSRSGRLAHWALVSHEAPAVDDAERELLASAGPHSGGIVSAVANAFRDELATVPTRSQFPEPPAEGSAASAGLKTPVPYNRIKPAYTEQAYLHGVRATVDAEVSIDADGMIANIDIVRWAGYGLDESVIHAVRSMNWRPAEQSGKRLPMRILLRYNFTKIEK